MGSNEKRIDSSIVAKAGMWYTICNFAFKGMAFITTPIFARLLTKSELGYFSNYASWVTILIVLTSFDFSQSIIRSKLDLEEDMDSYIWSILSLSTIWTLFVYVVICLFPDFFTNLLQVEMKHIHVMFLYLLAVPAYIMLITKHRAFYKYKMFVAITGVATVLALGTSLVMVLLMEDKVTGRIIGNYTPYIIIGFIIYFYIALKGKRIKLQYWKYACVLCLPLVPHILSMNLLNSSDKIIVTKLCGTEYTAIYGIAYSCYHIATILMDSLNKAWAPWLLDNLHIEKYQEIKKVSKTYVLTFALIVVMVLLCAPEAILILGGKQYADAVYCMPPLIASCVVQLIYTMYVNIEFFKKKTIGVSIATMIATGINIILNFIFIPMLPERGYVIASYTTLAGYLILFVLHYFMVKRMKLEFVFDLKYLLTVIGIILVFSDAMNLLYQQNIIRYVLIVVYMAAVAVYLYKKKAVLLSLIRKK